MLRRLIALAAAGALVIGAPATAQIGSHKDAAKSGFTFPATGSVKILVFRPDVQVGAQTAGGMNEPNADWTATARKQLTEALARAQQARSNELVMMPELEGDQAALLNDYRSLFRAVSSAVIAHKLFVGNRLPTKKAEFNWTLGEGAAKLAEIGGGDYGLFIFSNDSYGSAGRKAVQAGGLPFGGPPSGGGPTRHAGPADPPTPALVLV